MRRTPLASNEPVLWCIVELRWAWTAVIEGKRSAENREFEPRPGAICAVHMIALST